MTNDQIRIQALECARNNAGMTLKLIARKLHRTERTIRHHELHGTFYRNALKLARLYKCPVDLFCKRLAPGDKRKRKPQKRTQTPTGIGV